MTESVLILNMKIVLTVVFIIANLGLSQANCKAGWTYFKGYGCYYFDGENPMTWEDAREFCISQEGSLVKNYKYII